MKLPQPPLLRPVVWLAGLSLAITAVRLVGEVLRWSPEYWSRLPGGGLSPLGITWLVPVVGFYLGLRLQRAGLRPSPVIQAALQPPLAFAALGGMLVLIDRLRASGNMRPLGWTVALSLWGAASLIAALLGYLAWPALGRPLLLYAFLARVPVAAVMALATFFAWGTHYDVVPPGFPRMTPLETWLWNGLLPQTTIWIGLTMAVGGLFGALGWLAAGQLVRLRDWVGERLREIL